jgi:hypothetical protein
MKNILFFLLLIITSSLHAQTYQPFQLSRSYYYEHDNILDFVVSIDSVSISGNTYFNYGQERLCDIYTPDPLGKGMYLNPGRDSFFICRNDNDSLLLLSKSQPGESWVMYEAAGIRYIATHKQSIQQKLWDEILDSVKLFSIMALDSLGDSLAYNGVDSFALSKRFGMTSYFDPNLFPDSPTLILKGVASPQREWGDQWLDRWQIFDYEVGDEFHISDYFFNADILPNTSIQQDICIRERVIYANKDTATRFYEIEQSILTEMVVKEFDGSGKIISYDSTMNLTTDTISRMVQYVAPQHRPFKLNDGATRAEAVEVYYKGGNYGAETVVRNEFLVNPFPEPTDTCVFSLIGTFREEYAIMGVGDGFFLENYFGGNPFVTSHREPIYIRNRFVEIGDSSFINDKIRNIKASSEPLESLPIKIFPNPVNDIVNIQYPEISEGKLQLISLDGRVWGEWPLPQELIRLEQIPSGIYILKLNSRKGSHQQKLVKQ